MTASRSDDGHSVEIAFLSHGRRLSTTTRAIWWLPAVMLIAILTCNAPLTAQTSPMLSDWQEPTGSVIRIEPCSSGFCIRVLLISSRAHTTFDIYNPDRALRGRPLCNLDVGNGFSFTDPTHASGGTLYDPKSGNTYRGKMAVEGDSLRLRGYIMFPIFGRTETWRRVHGSFQSCR
jgi:uncharacterized protein (DUF2147 family)